MKRKSTNQKQVSLLDEIERRESEKWREERNKQTGVIKVLRIPVSRSQEFYGDLARLGNLAVGE